MTIPRVVALAQALALTLILVPGLQADGPPSAAAAPETARPSDEAGSVFGAAGSGIGCVVGREYRGPRAPGDPPWPPGAKPTPSPEPSPVDVEPTSPVSSATASASPQARSGSDASDVAGTMAFLATSVRVAQADPIVEPSAAPGVSAAPATPDPGNQRALITGIDISHHNGDVDFAKIRKAGYRFVYLKVSQDNDFIDPMFATNLARARAAGLAAGGYHFFDYTLDGREQADHFLDRLEAIGGLEDALPPVVDVECWSPIGSSIHAVSAARLRDLVERIYERTGRLPIIYTSVRMWEEVVGEPSGFEDLPLWAACWDCSSPPSLATGWDDWTFWQTGVDRIRGVGSLDGNYFRGDVAELADLRLRPVSLEDGAAVTARQEVSIDLGGRTATHVRTAPDGQDWSRWIPVRGTVRAQLGSDEGDHSLRIQLRRGTTLKSPVFSDSITLDRSGPELSEPAVSLGLGPLVGEGQAVPVEVTWQASDEVAGLSDASVSMTCEGHRAVTAEAAGAAEPGVETTWSAVVSAEPEAACHASVVARDGVGNATRGRSPTVLASMVAATGDLPGATLDAAQAGIVARRGPDQGRAIVRIDGQEAGLVDLYAPEPGGPEIVHVVDLAPGAQHEVVVEPTGTSDAAASGSGITIEGFAVLG